MSNSSLFAKRFGVSPSSVDEKSSKGLFFAGDW